MASDVFDPQRLAHARQRITVEAAKADSDATRGGYTTTEVAQLLDVATPNVRRSAARGELYTSGLRHNREHMFPVWQFPGGRPIPHLREDLQALPTDMHPLDVAAFISTPHDGLGGRTLAEWLAHGGSVDPVVQIKYRPTAWPGRRSPKPLNSATSNSNPATPTN